MRQPPEGARNGLGSGPAPVAQGGNADGPAEPDPRCSAWFSFNAGIALLKWLAALFHEIFRPTDLLGGRSALAAAGAAAARAERRGHGAHRVHQHDAA